MKLTKRKGFNFFRSYYDVYNLLSNEDKVAFMDALLDRQFLGVKPDDLKGMAQFAYVSQTNSIDSQVKGYEDKTKTKLNPLDENNYTPTVGVNEKVLTPALQVQVEVQEKEKGEYTLYSERDFLKDWKELREDLINKPTNVDRLSPRERTSFADALKDFKKERIVQGLNALFRQEVVNFTSMQSRPQHFLDHIDKYTTAYDEKDTKLYGAKAKKIIV